MKRDSKEIKGPTHGQETKVCPVCGRAFANRKSWASRGQWESVKYCSDRCRKGKAKASSAEGEK